MSPGSAEASVAQRDEDADGNHARVAQLLLLGGLVDKGAEAGMLGAVDKVDEVVGDGVEARGERLVLDEALELDGRGGALPDNGVAGLDVKVDEEEGRERRESGGSGGREGSGRGRGRRRRGASRRSHGGERTAAGWVSDVKCMAWYCERRLARSWRLLPEGARMQKDGGRERVYARGNRRCGVGGVDEAEDSKGLCSSYVKNANLQGQFTGGAAIRVLWLKAGLSLTSQYYGSDRPDMTSITT